MNVIEAIQARHAVRDFSCTPVPQETILKILDVATRSSSGGNTWNGHAVEQEHLPGRAVPAGAPLLQISFGSGWRPSATNA